MIHTEYQKMMELLRQALDLVNQVTTEASTMLNELTNHNQDALSHPDIRNQIETAGLASTTFVDDRISGHNLAEDSHPALAAKIEEAVNNTAVIRQVVDDTMNSHNTDSNSHSDMRSSLNAINAILDAVDVTALNADVAFLMDNVTVSIAEAILALQSVDAKHDAQILDNVKSIELLQSNMIIVETDLNLMLEIIVTSYEDITDLVLKTFVVDTNAKLGYDQYLADGPNLLDFECSLDRFVGPNTSVEFAFSGAKDSAGGSDVTYNIIEPISGEVVFSTNAGITNGQTVTANVGNGNHGDKLWFTVEVVDTTNNKTVKRVIAAIFASPIRPEHVQAYGLIHQVEPGSDYKFTVRNIVDNDGTRFSYSIDPLTSNLIFSKTLGIDNHEEIIMSVPASAPRDQYIDFEIVVHDKYLGIMKITETVYVNPLPGAEDFEHTIPAISIPGRTYSFKMWGLISANGIPLKYDLLNVPIGIEFNKTTGILTNENVSLTISPHAVRGEEYNFTVRAIDENGVTIDIEQGTIINRPPISDNILTTLPATTKGGTQIPITISGGVDEDGGELTYTIAANGSGLSFNKTSDISSVDVILVSFPKVSVDEDKTFEIFAVDSQGEASAVGKEIEIKVTPIYLIETPSIIYPHDGDDKVAVDFDMQCTAIVTTVDMSK